MRAPNFTQAVWDELDQDLQLQSALFRDLINARAVARMLKDRLGLDASIPGIVSAIKRYPVGDYAARYDRARAALADVRISTRTKVVALALRKDPEAFAAVPRLLAAVDISKGETIRVIQTDESILVIVDDPKLETFLQLVPKHLVQSVNRPLAELSIREPTWSTSVPGPLFLITSALFASAVNIWGLMSAAHEVVVLISEADLSVAHRTIIRLSQAAPAPPEKAAPPPVRARVRARRTIRAGKA